MVLVRCTYICINIGGDGAGEGALVCTYMHMYSHTI